MSESLRLPSGGDTSYAGLVGHKELLWISYHSSHEGRTSNKMEKPEFLRMASKRQMTTIRCSLLLTATLLPSVLLTGCIGETTHDFAWVGIWWEIPWLALLAKLIKWTFLGSFLGFSLGAGLFLVLWRLRLYDYPGTTGKWITRAICAWMVVSCTALAGAGGWFEGMYHGADVALRESPIGNDWLPKAGTYAADLLFSVDQQLNQRQMPAETLDVKRFVDELELLREGVVEKLANQIIDQALAQNPNWKGTRSEFLTRWILSWLARKLADQQLRDFCKGWRVHDFAEELQTQAASQEGLLMDRARLGRFLSDQVIVPAILRPIRSWIRMTQCGIVLMGLGAIALPVIAVRLLQWLFLNGNKGEERPSAEQSPTDGCR